jgi:hypothetical protein
MPIAAEAPKTLRRVSRRPFSVLSVIVILLDGGQ